MKDYYKILGIDFSASKNDISAIYSYKLGNTGDSSIEDIKEAYCVLSSYLKRFNYDRKYKKHYTLKKSKKTKSRTKNKKNIKINNNTDLKIKQKKDLYSASEQIQRNEKMFSLISIFFKAVRIILSYISSSSNH